ncbi:hypothetical protein N9L68_03515, partial [bacterium]|nr:hypothetical protein [bacterium]
VLVWGWNRRGQGLTGLSRSGGPTRAGVADRAESRRDRGGCISPREALRTAAAMGCGTHWKSTLPSRRGHDHDVVAGATLGVGEDVRVAKGDWPDSLAALAWVAGWCGLPRYKPISSEAGR